jgi:nitroreductase
MSVYELIKKRRSIRRFLPKQIPYEILQTIVDAGRLAPSGSNLQPLEFIVVDDPELVASVFDHTRWAGYLPPEIGPPPAGQRPEAFVVVLCNRQKSSTWTEHDAGAAIENMILVALDEGIGSCLLGSIAREEIKRILSIPEHCDIDSVLALGYPNEEPVMVEFQGSVKYWRDEKGVQHVPKRALTEVIHHNKY